MTPTEKHHLICLSPFAETLNIVGDYSSGRPLVYLATPYSHKDPAVRTERFNMVNKVAGALMQQGLIIFSPISHTHPVAVKCGLPKDWQYWEKFDRAYLSCSNKLLVLCLDGWLESNGVQAEIKIAREMGIPVEYIHIE